MLANVQEARQQQQALNSLWWDAHKKFGDTNENTVNLRDQIRALETDAIAKFGMKSDCEQCRRNSVFGGPGHNASSMCRSGKRNHCTCDTCW